MIHHLMMNMDRNYRQWLYWNTNEYEHVHRYHTIHYNLTNYSIQAIEHQLKTRKRNIVNHNQNSVDLLDELVVVVVVDDDGVVCGFSTSTDPEGIASGGRSRDVTVKKS
jgi:hypothetical protein